MWFGRRVHRLWFPDAAGIDVQLPAAAGASAASDTAIFADAAALTGDTRLAQSLVELGLEIVHEVRGPMRLWDFARRLERRLGMPRVGAGELSEALKAALERIDDPRLGVLATSMPGVGYVYDTRDPDSRPVRASR
jgi:hypothetical protein